MNGFCGPRSEIVDHLRAWPRLRIPCQCKLHMVVFQAVHSARRHALQLTWGAGSGGKVCRKWGWPLTGLKSRTNQDKPRQIKTNKPLINSNHHESGLINKKGGLPLANLVRICGILCHFEMPLGSVALHSQPAREFSSHFASDFSNICVI